MDGVALGLYADARSCFAGDEQAGRVPAGCSCGGSCARQHRQSHAEVDRGLSRFQCTWQFLSRAPPESEAAYLSHHAIIVVVVIVVVVIVVKDGEGGTPTPTFCQPCLLKHAASTLISALLKRTDLTCSQTTPSNQWNTLNIVNWSIHT